MAWVNASSLGPANLYAPRKLLANLWARGAALQCCFSQEAIDLLIPLYLGSVHPNSIFDPSLLSAVVVQVKYKTTGDKNAEHAIRPIGVPRDHNPPLPYLAILMELGSTSRYQETRKRIKYEAPEILPDSEFGILHKAWKAAENDLETHCGKNTKKDTLKEYEKKYKDARLAVDSWNRYSISVRGVSKDEYGILHEANVVEEFATLLSIVIPLSGEQSTRSMRPLERLSDKYHTAWMSDYGVSNEVWRW